MELAHYSVGPLAANCYLLWDPGVRRAILIDPGDDGDYLSDQIHRQGLTLTHILLTHGHFDHVLGLLPLHLNFPAARIYLHPADHFLYQRAGESARHWVKGYAPDPLPEATALSVDLPPFITLIKTPGHTPGSVCFSLPSKLWLFTGDTLFRSGVGDTHHRYSSPLKLSQSLKKLSLLPPGTQVFPGHGEGTTIGTEFP